jgi:hypothetical protein
MFGQLKIPVVEPELEQDTARKSRNMFDTRKGRDALFHQKQSKKTEGRVVFVHSS